MACRNSGYTVALFLALFVVAACPAKGQQATNAQITGLVSDVTGGSVPGASVKAINTATNVEYHTVTNDAGVYVLADLVPGPYKITVSKEGFETQVQAGLTVRTADRLGINFQLKPGQVITTVEVKATVEAISTDDASYSTVVDNRMITDLPQLSRNTLDQLTKVTPAIQGQGLPQLGAGADFTVGVNGGTFAVAGGQRNGTIITVDGGFVQDAEIQNVNRAVPTPDSIGEFRVQSGVLPADVGRYSGGVITLSTRSGTNKFHGGLFYYGRNQNLNANTWANNALGVPKQPFHQSNYGLSVGGPVWLPKIYNGKDKTFFFFAWEAQRYSTSSLAESSVPTPLERDGNFSQSIINHVGGEPVYARIFDPFQFNDTNDTRFEYPNATIPPDKQVKLISYYMNLYPMPNHDPAVGTSSTNNYFSTRRRELPNGRETLRLDHNFNERHRIYARATRYRALNSFSAPFFHTSGEHTFDNNWTGTLQYNWLPSPTSVFELRLGGAYASLVTHLGSDADPNIDTDQWPFDPQLFKSGLRINKHIPPGLYGGAFGGSAFHSPVGGLFFDHLSQEVFNGSVSFTKVVNRHSLKAGYQHYFAISDDNGGDLSGATDVTNGGGSNQYWNNPDGLTGHPLAELMLGSSSFFNWGNWNIGPLNHMQTAYVMDDWKVNNKLSLQLGLRYDHENGRHPRYPYGVIFDLNAKNVLKPNAGWSWDQVVGAVPDVANFPQPVWLTQGVNGHMILINTPEHPQNLIYGTKWGILQPRIGVSYALDSKTVLHGSFGDIYQGLSGLQTEYGGSFYYGTVTFSQFPTLDGKHWVSEFGLDHGLGTFPLQSDGSRLGYYLPITNNQQFWNATYGACHPLGCYLSYAAPGTYDYPHEYTWGLSLQRQLGTSWVVSAEYMGVRGVNLLTPAPQYRYTNISPSYYGLRNELFEPVPNPFFGQSQAFAAESTLPLYQLLGSMPQYASAGPGYLTAGKSMSQFVNFQMQSRNWHGLSLLASYSIRKTLINNFGKDLRQPGPPIGYRVFQDPNNLNEGYGVALYERPQQLLLNYHYELPVGRGRYWLGNVQGWGGRALNAVAGGWGVAGVTRWWPKGEPVLAPAVDGSVAAPGFAGVRWSAAGNYKNPNVDFAKALVDPTGSFASGFVRQSFDQCPPGGVFNCSVFVRTPDFSFGNLPIIYPNARNPGGFETDATIFKSFYFSENRERYLEFRLEALNFFNHPNFGPVDNDPDSPTFGGILGKCANPTQPNCGFRIMQLGLRLFF